VPLSAGASPKRPDPVQCQSVVSYMRHATTEPIDITYYARLNRVSEIVAIVSGCTGALTGVTALVISLQQHLQSRPSLKLEVSEATHWIDNTFAVHFPEHPTSMTSFNVWLDVSNLGKDATEVVAPEYVVVWRGKRWKMGSHFQQVAGGSPGKSLSPSVAMPGRSFRRLYIHFTIPVAIRQSIDAQFECSDGAGKHFVLGTRSGWLGWEEPSLSQVVEASDVGHEGNAMLQGGPSCGVPEQDSATKESRGQPPCRPTG
jgi:hypothetical protein